jgi:DNA-binding MarR family transcriptional regulator
LISRFGRYKVFPVLGTALITVGLYLLSRLGVTTGALASSAYMFVLGLGLGGVLQVLVIAVQNAVDYADLGAATSGVTFFRSMGGSFGTAVFGAIFANTLAGNLRHYLHGVTVPAGLSSASISPSALRRLPPAVHTGFIHAYAHSLQTVFLVAVPIGAVAFILSWTLPELKLRSTTGAVDTRQTFTQPLHATSATELERALCNLIRRENRRELFRRLAAYAGVEVEPVVAWLLLRIDRHPDWPASRLAHEPRVDQERVRSLLAGMASNGLLVSPDGSDAPPTLTPAGEDAVARLVTARRARINELLDGWSPEEQAEIKALVGRLTAELLDDEVKTPPEPVAA